MGRGLPVLRLEDGFLRSVGLGSEDPPLSIAVDDLGIYYDAALPSRLESLIATPLTDAQRLRAQALVLGWKSARVSKYNHAREFAGRLPERYVLAADQTRGDASIRYGLADASCFDRMLKAALNENPDCTVLLKVHPEVLAGRKKGHFDLEAAARDPRVRVLGQDVHPAGLIEKAGALYVVSSQVGFEGLLWGKRVRVFGMPFYAGWGLTEDDLPPPERRRPSTLEQLAHAALAAYPRYRDPETGSRCEVERVLEWLALQRRQRERFPAQVHALGFSLWKRPIVRTFFQGSEVRFINDAGRVPPAGTLVVWGRAAGLPEGRGARTLRLEDGFLRSVGLGADLVRPLSWAVDGRGMYYDASAPSELEHILQTTLFDPALAARGKALRERIAALGLTKYNVSGTAWQRPVAGQRVVLVPGQVELDASIRFGAAGIRTNLDLLRAVRNENPGAYVIYKPHPDVVAGLRRRGAGESEAGRWCDELLPDAGMNALLDAVDEVHVLTSLAGFEALLRNKRVTTYGQPFYAGWGLTHDMAPLARRTRRLSLDELVAGVLIEYPLYVSRTTKRYTSPERALDELAAWREKNSSGLPLWRRGLRIALRFQERWRRSGEGE
jgi:capsular polysaccharide export protein